jgi:Sulfotransferase domain
MQVGAKIFCIGANKTGTTSLEAFFKTLGCVLGNQAEGELLIRHWAVRNFAPIVELARSAQVSQDMPFSLPFTYVALDEAFPTAKFILSVRDNAEQWYRSLTRFHAQLIGKGRLPTANDLKDCPYRYRGWLFEAMQLIYGISEKEPYEKVRLIAQYDSHNRSVADYFRLRPEALLTLNLSETDAATKIMTFLELPFTGETMPHLNRSV